MLLSDGQSPIESKDMNRNPSIAKKLIGKVVLVTGGSPRYRPSNRQAARCRECGGRLHLQLGKRQSRGGFQCYRKCRRTFRPSTPKAPALQCPSHTPPPPPTPQNT